MSGDRSTHWKERLTPLVGAAWPIRCGRTFSAAELALLREGLWPLDMDDRWIVWLDGNELRCWRSWTCTCVYRAMITLNPDGSGVANMVDVLDDPVAYQRARTEASELERFEGVVHLALMPARAQ